MTLNLKKVLLFTGLILSIGSQCHANDSESPLNAIYACAAITNDSQRLECFDRTVPAVQIKESKKEIIALDAKQAKAIEKDSFGFSLPSLPKFGLIKDSKKSKSSAQEFQVKNISKTRKGIAVTMENDQVWQQTSGDTGYIPKGNVKAKIKEAAFGSFFLVLENEKGKSGKGIRVKRVK